MVDGPQIRRRRRGEEVDPASDGTADAERRERQSGLRRALRDQFPSRNRDNLLPVLHLLQHEHGYLPEWALQVVGWHLRVPASEVYGSATSYSELSSRPAKATQHRRMHRAGLLAVGRRRPPERGVAVPGPGRRDRA